MVVTELLKKEHNENEFDNFFFRKGTAWPFGKEYWFIHFSSMPDDIPLHISLVFGDTKTGLRAESIDTESAALCWSVIGRKKSIFMKPDGKFKLESKTLSIKNKENEISISGSYPYYEVKCTGKDELELVTSENKIWGYQIDKLLNAPVIEEKAMELATAFLDFKGNINGKKYSGHSYVQRVQLGAPLVPWVWTRLYLNKGIAIETFFLKNDVLHLLDEIRIFYPNKKRKIIKGALELNKKWELFFKGKKLYQLKPIEHEKIEIENIRKFVYNQYFVSCEESNLKDIELDNLTGRGVLEDTYGFFL